MATNLVESALTNLRSLYQNEGDLMLFVDQEMKKLESNMSSMVSLLQDAEEKQLKGTSRGIDDWLQKLEDAIYVLEDILDECLIEAIRDTYEGDRSCSFLSFLHPDKIKFRHSISARMKAIREQLDIIAQEKNQFSLVPFVADPTVARYTSASLLQNIPRGRQTASAITEDTICGREEDKEKIVYHLLQEDGSNAENLTVHTIWGMGGLGKTTLAQLVYNDQKVQNHFELKIWICVSENFEIETLIKAIIGSPQSHDPLDSLQNQLLGKLRGKRYLLVLDDVWNDNQEKWNHLRCLLSCGSKGSSVLVTTRQLKIATIMRTPPVEPYHLTVLTNDDCWQVFKRRAFGLSVVEETESLVTIGKEIVRKCRGVPLAAKTLGGVLSFKSDERSWLHVRNSELWNLSNSDDSIFGALKLSYLNLPTKCRRCFSYCALFPKDYRIEKEDIINIWIANGLITSEGLMSTTVDVDDIGDEIVHELRWRSLIDDIQVDEFGDIKSFKMHDLVHDLAHSTMGDVIAHLPGSDAELQPRIRHLWSAGDLNKKPMLLKNVKGIRTFFFYFYTSKFLTNIYEQMSLRALDFKAPADVPEFLSSIYVLKHLRYLNLRESDIVELPESICSLWNLQCLNLDRCYELTTLPNGMGRLKSLRHLYLRSCTRLSNIPMSMGNLTSLRTWSIVIAGESEKLGFQLSALHHFKHLKGEMEIKNLERVREVRHAQEANLMEKRDLDRLTLTWRPGRGDVDHNGDPQHEMLILDSLRPSPKLKSLKVMGYGGARFPQWMMDGIASFRYLQSVILSDCRLCPQLPPLWRLPSLKRLSLEHLDSVRYMIECRRDLSGNEDIRGFSFSSLEELTLVDLDSLEAVVRANDRDEEEEAEIDNKQNIQLFPHLSSLTIIYCPSMSSIMTCGPLPSLRYLCINDIALLPSSSPSNVQILSSLEELHIMGDSNDSLSFPANQILQGMSSLRKLSISWCANLKSLHEVDTSSAALPQLDTPSFPVSLHSLSLDCCENLESFPDWLSDAISLEEIAIWHCPKLLSIPNFFRRLTKLKSLYIYNCPVLVSRCRNETGEDWDNIAHVLQIIT